MKSEYHSFKYKDDSYLLYEWWGESTYDVNMRSIMLFHRLDGPAYIYYYIVGGQPT